MSSLSIRTLPIVERWDCHSCSNCCRGGIISLDEDDLAKLRQQDWQRHPDFRNQRIIQRDGLLKKTYHLAKRADGSCIFLTEDGLCCIHKEYGEEAKPLVCRVFPLQLVSLGSFAYLTTRRSCPSAAADRGRLLEEHRRDATKLLKSRRFALNSARPPKITHHFGGTWKDFLPVTDTIQRLMCDSHFPLVRRLLHALQFCDLLERCHPKKLGRGQFSELVGMLEESAAEGVAEFFQDDRPPKRYASMLFRQAAAEYIRLHPSYVARSHWRQRWRLAVSAVGFVRGKGRVPQLHPAFPPAVFENLERPLGMLDDDVYRPLLANFQATVTSRQYAVLGRSGWSLVESFRALALSFPVALWILRYACGDRAPTAVDMVDIVTLVNRGQGYAALSGGRYGWAIRQLARGNQLQRLIVWYAR